MLSGHMNVSASTYMYTSVCMRDTGHKSLGTGHTQRSSVPLNFSEPPGATQYYI